MIGNALCSLRKFQAGHAFFKLAGGRFQLLHGGLDRVQGFGGRFDRLREFLSPDLQLAGTVRLYVHVRAHDFDLGMEGINVPRDSLHHGFEIAQAVRPLIHVVSELLGSDDAGGDRRPHLFDHLFDVLRSHGGLVRKTLNLVCDHPEALP